MPSKKDVTVFKHPSLKAILESPPQEEEKSSLPKPRKPGRKRKAPEEKETEMIAIMLTPREKEALKERAGLVKLGTFVKHHLRTKTDFLQ